MSQNDIDWVVESYVDYIIIGTVLSWAAAVFVDALTWDFLKKIFIVIKIGKLKFSISAFFIAVFLVKLLLFH